MDQDLPTVRADQQVWPNRLLRWGIITILILVPFHAFLTVWASSLLGHYELVRLWKEYILMALYAVVLYLIARDRELRQRMFGSWVVRLAIAYIAFITVWALAALLKGTVSSKAVGYGLIVDTRPVIFLIIIMAAIRNGLNLPWAKIIVAPALVVAAFALLQFFVLPRGFLTHFGYGSATVRAYQTIDDSLGNTGSNPVRVQSFERGPNTLGAYLLPVTALLVLGCVHFKEKGRYGAAIGLTGLALMLTFSRSAILGTVLSVAILLGWTVQRQSARRLFWWGGVVVLSLALGTVIALKDVNTAQNVLFHTSESTGSNHSPNSLHLSAWRGGAGDIARHPLGGGIGSAGPASVYNGKSHVSLAENYFLQIGQEAGIAGLGLFVALLVFIIMRLWDRRQHGLTRAALAVLFGLILVNMFSHAWTDDTLAYISWALLAIGLSVKVSADALDRQAPAEESTSTAAVYEKQSAVMTVAAANKTKSTKKVQKP